MPLLEEFNTNSNNKKAQEESNKDRHSMKKKLQEDELTRFFLHCLRQKGVLCRNNLITKLNLHKKAPPQLPSQLTPSLQVSSIFMEIGLSAYNILHPPKLFTLKSLRGESRRKKCMIEVIKTKCYL